MLGGRTQVERGTSHDGKETYQSHHRKPALADSDEVVHP